VRISDESLCIYIYIACIVTGIINVYINYKGKSMSNLIILFKYYTKTPIENIDNLKVKPYNDHNINYCDVQ